MTEYKVVSVSSMWSSKKLEERTTELINQYAREGWQFRQMAYGFNSWMVPTIFITLEREKTGL